MRLAAVAGPVVLAALITWPAAASAGVLAGSALTLAPDREDGGLDVWVARDWGAVYAGGEIATETFTRGPGDLGMSYHVVGGGRLRLSPRISVLADAGLGVTQQVGASLGILDDSGLSFDTEGWAPSGALRVHLLAQLGERGATRCAFALTSDARATPDHAGVGLGLGLVFAR